MKKTKKILMVLALLLVATTPAYAQGTLEDQINNYPEEDSDGDGVFDSEDNCPGTAAGETVNETGCSSADLLNPEIVIDDEGDIDDPNAFNPSDPGVSEGDEPNLFNPSDPGQEQQTPGGSGGRVNFECNDGADNDGDGKIDYPSDPGCSQSRDDSEGSEGSGDSDNNGSGNGRDDDNDGETGTTTDSDEHYVGSGDDTTGFECSDGKDNDGDGLIDFPVDPDCNYKTDPSEGEPVQQAAPEKETAVKSNNSKGQLTSSGPEAVLLIASSAALAAAYVTRKKAKAIK